MRAELVIDVLEHEAGHVVAEDAGVDAVGHRAQMLDVPLLQLFDVLLNLPHLRQVEAGVVLAALERRDDAFRGRLRCTPRKGRHRDVKHLRAGLDGRHVRHGRHPARAVRVHVDRNIDQWMNRRADHRSDGEIRHIVVVHHVEMDEVGTGLHDSGNLRAKAGEIRGENTRSDACLHGALLSDVETCIATS